MPTSSPNAKDHLLVAFGAAVRATRVHREISQEELAHRSGIDRSYLGAIERGEQNAGLLHVAKIASALEITMSELFASAGM